MSSYIYNGVSLGFVRTTHYEMGTERDPSNTDVLWNKYTIRVRGFCTTSGLGIAPTNSSAAIQFLKNSLEQPRRGFFYSQDTTTILNIGVPGGPAVDAKLGPEPLPATIREVSSGTFAIECGVIVRRVECITETDENGNACPPNPVVSLRWSQSEGFDSNWYSTLVTDGRLIVRSDLLQSADNFRPLCTPPILADYQRMNSKYTLSPDGMELAFTFTDVERDRLPPFPATDASGEFTITCPRASTQRMGQVSINLEGQKGTSRLSLLVKAFNMCYAKLFSDNKAKTIPILWGTFTEDLFKPKIKVVMQAMLSPIQKRGGAGAAIVNGIGGALRAGRILPPIAPQIMPSVGLDTFGLATNKNGIAPPNRKRISGLLTAAFADPCACLLSEVDLVNQPNQPNQPGTTGGNTDIISGVLTTKGSASFDIAPLLPWGGAPTVDDSAPYDTYEIEATYFWDEGTVQLPGTGVGSSPGISSFVQVHGGKMMMSVVWVAGRTGDPPVLPAYQSQDPNLVQLGGNIVLRDEKESADGAATVYRVAGYYTYGVVDPTKVSISAPIPPFLDIGQARQTAPLEAAYFSNVPLFSFVGVTGPNPFVGQTQSMPNTANADQAAALVDLGITMAEGQSPTTSSSAGAGGGQLGGLGGNSPGGGLFPVGPAFA